MRYLSDTFSLEMLDVSQLRNVTVRPISASTIAYIMGRREVHSCIGHAHTAATLSALLGKEVVTNHCSISLYPGDTLYVASTLPDGMAIQFLIIEVVQHLVPYIGPDYDKGSIYGAIRTRGELLADEFCGTCADMQDKYGNFCVQIISSDFRATLCDN